MRFFTQICREAGHFAPLVVGAVLVLAATCGSALALNPPTPEIDPGAIGSAITLFVGGAMYLTSRRRAR